MVISELVRAVASKLMFNPRFEAEIMVMSVLGINRTQLITDGKRIVTDRETANVNEMVNRRLSGEPLQYITGECEFMSLSFFTDRGVLIPRSDTETLVETVLEQMDGEKTNVLDICAGSGCIGISIAHYRKNAFVRLIDISDKALETAQKNIEKNNVSSRVSAMKMDILQECPVGEYDIIVSNPPYIETETIGTLQTEVKDFEPILALDGGADGLMFYRRIAEITPLILKKDGIMAFEIGYKQGDAVKEIMENNFLNVKVIKDLCGNDRVVTGRCK